MNNKNNKDNTNGRNKPKDIGYEKETQKIQQYMQNMAFQNNVRRYKEQVNEKIIKKTERPDVNKKYFSKLWLQRQELNKKTEKFIKLSNKLHGSKNDRKWNTSWRNSQEKWKLKNTRSWLNTWLLVETIYVDSRKYLEILKFLVVWLKGKLTRSKKI